MKWGRCEYRQLIKLRDNLAKLQSADLDKFCRDTSKELAARLLSLVIPATPVGNYKTEVKVTAKRDSKHHKKGDVYTKRVNRSGKMGGTLRRGWTARTESEAAGGQGHPTLRPCPFPSRAALTLWRSSTPSIMPAMWSLGTARPAAAGSRENTSLPYRSNN